ncbi:MAG: porin [Kordia sp.]|nr:MAG: porin [Kordia sp.]
MKNLRSYLSVFIILVGLSAVAQETNSPKFGKGLFNLVGKDSTWTMKIGARMQFLTTNAWDLDANGDFGKAQNTFLVRRARLKFSGFAYSPKLTYKLELGLSNKDIGGASKYTNNAPRYILDAVVKWNFYKNFSLWAGQTKLPGNRERVISSGNLQFVDRSKLNSNFNLDRDLGLQLRHHFNLSDKFLVRDMFSISQGEGRNITTGNLGGHQYTARVEVLPFGEFKGKGDYSGSDLKREDSPKLAIGATYNLNDKAVKNKGSQGSYMENDSAEGFYETNVNTVFVDAMFKYKGISFMGEYANRDANKATATDVDGTPTGDAVKKGNSINAQVGYLFKSNWEVAGRYTTVKFNGADYATNYYTLGASKYLVGHKLKVQSDITYNDVTGSKSGGLEYRLQFDIHF